MLNKFTKWTLGALLVLSVGCSPKKKADQQGLDGADGAAISSEAMSFNVNGSDSGTIAGLSTINFAYDSSALDSRSRTLLAENAAWIKANGRVTVQIEGHCDSRGSVEYNLALGERRAKSVKDYLVGLGVKSNQMTIISYGKEKPVENGDSEAVHARNRRANFVPLSN